jgi:hypothetical protein
MVTDRNQEASRSLHERVPDVDWGECQVTVGGDRWTADLHAVAASRDGLYALSIVGPGTTVQAIAASMQASNMNPRIRCEKSDGTYGFVYRVPGVKYLAHRNRISYSQWQLLMLANHEYFLRSNSDEALWQELSSERYTTPVLRAWVPWIRDRLEQEELLKPLVSVNCNSALMQAQTKDLDDLITEGLQSQAITIQ